MMKHFSLIPGPRGLPIIGSNWQYLPIIGKYSKERMHEPLQELRQRYGPIVREKVVSGRYIVHLFDPGDMMSVYHQEMRYPMRMSHRAILQFRLSRPGVYSPGGGLLPSNGEEWRRLRQPFARLLLDTKAVSKQLGAVQEVSADLVRLLMSKGPEPWDWSEDLHLWALECVGKITLSVRLGCLGGNDPKSLQMVRAASETHMGVMLTENGLPFYRFLPTPVYSRLARAQTFMEQQVQEYMRPTLEKFRRGDCTKESGSLLENMLHLEMVDEKDVFTMIMDMFLAGIDTTSFSMGYLLYNLSTHPEIQERCRQEVLDATGGAQELTEESLEKLTYLRMCIKETLRLYPISIGVGRILSRPIEIKGYDLQPMTIIVNHHMVSSRDSDNYPPDPLTFRPERHDRTSEGYHKPKIGASMPWGAGARSCIGRRLAEQQMQVLTARLLLTGQRVKWAGKRHLGICTRLINVPDQPLLFRLEP